MKYECRENQESYVNSNIENLRGDLTTARKSLFNNRLVHLMLILLEELLILNPWCKML